MRKIVAKILGFTIYLAFLVAILVGLKEILITYTDFSSWMKPTVCYFLNRLQADILIASSIAFASSNWLKARVVAYWTN